MPRYRFIGGPCDGRLSQNFAERPLFGLQIRCGGQTYEFAWDGSFRLESYLRPPVAVPKVETKQVGRAWHKLMSAFAINAPRQLRQARATRRRFRRAVR
jgi:hypothetical protein